MSFSSLLWFLIIKFLGTWIIRKRNDQEVGDGTTSFPSIETLVLNLDGTFKIDKIERHWGGFIKATGKGQWTFTSQTIFLGGEMKNRDICTRCGEPWHTERLTRDIISITRTHQQWKDTYSRKFDVVCFHCNKKGHISTSCPERNCFICGKAGHLAKKCPTPDAILKPKEVVTCENNKFLISKKEIVYKEKK